MLFLRHVSLWALGALGSLALAAPAPAAPSPTAQAPVPSSGGKIVWTSLAIVTALDHYALLFQDLEFATYALTRFPDGSAPGPVHTPKDLVDRLTNTIESLVASDSQLASPAKPVSADEQLAILTTFNKIQYAFRGGLAAVGEYALLPAMPLRPFKGQILPPLKDLLARLKNNIKVIKPGLSLDAGTAYEADANRGIEAVELAIQVFSAM